MNKLLHKKKERGEHVKERKEGNPRRFGRESEKFKIKVKLRD
jgi:hypothetical protein